MRYWMLTVVATGLVLLSCSKTKLFENMPPADANSNIIVAAVIRDAQSAFKEALLDSLQAQYAGQYDVRRLSIKTADDLPKEGYRVLIVFDILRANYTLNSRTKAIMAHADPHYAIYYMTAGDPKWKWKMQDTHHLSSASDIKHISSAWQQLKNSVDLVLQSKQ